MIIYSIVIRMVEREVKLLTGLARNHIPYKSCM